MGAFLQQEGLKVSSRVELREDEGIGLSTRQYVSSNSFTKILDEDRRWLGQLNISWTDDEQNGGRDARFAEFELGHAIRPAKTDRLNVLAKYSYLYDLPSEGQATARPDERSHLLAVDALYDLSSKWELGGKFALRKGERRAMRDAGAWREFGQRLFAARARYHLTNEWDGLVEYRWLSDITGNNSRHGALLGAYYHVGENMKIGAGFNFTDFKDELRFDDYRSGGWYVDLLGKY